MSSRIALLVPTRGRPEQCKRMIESARNTAKDVTVLLAIQEDQIAAYADIDAPKLIVPDWPTVQSWNTLAQHALSLDCSLFMLGADDMVFATPGWEEALVQHYEALKEKAHVYGFQDSRDAEGLPHPVVTREWITAIGYFVCPIFLHWYIDTWTVAVAKANGVFTHLKDYLLVHDKPSDKGQPDETHSRIRRSGWHERDAYVAKTCDHMLKGEMLRLDNYLRNREVFEAVDLTMPRKDLGGLKSA